MADWIFVGRTEGGSDLDWRASNGLLQLHVNSMCGGDIPPIPSLSLHEAPSRSSLEFDGSQMAVRTSHIPPKILCVIEVFLRDELHLYLRPLFLDDRDDTTFDKAIKQCVQSYLENQGPAKKRSYQRAGRVRLLALSEDQLIPSTTVCVETSWEWDRHVTRMVTEYCNDIDGNHGEPTPFMLEVRLEYDWLSIDEDIPLDRGICQTLFDHRLTNLFKEEFWSKKLLKALFTEKTVKQLLAENLTWQKEAVDGKHVGEHQIHEEGKRFLQYIMCDRTRLLAAMMRARVDISCLYRLWKGGCKQYDSDPLDCQALAKVLRYWESDDLCKYMAGFNPLVFPRPNDEREPQRHHRVENGEVVPVIYDGPDGEAQVIGKGSFGTVYRVRVQADYHDFSPNKDDCYALKCLNKKLELASEVDREAGVLEMLALRPHPHITPLYASWTREGLTYILLPKADMSLKKFLRHEPAPDLNDQSKVTWLFRQLRGLASAVRHMHHFGFSGPNSTSAAALEARKRKLHMGYHHDLKPDNILVFDNCLKVSDFGAAKIQQLGSGKSTIKTPYTNNSPYGDEVYGGPDHKLSANGTVGQPYDIWSLGCIYLEILLWACGYGTNLVAIAKERENDRTRKCPGNCNSLLTPNPSNMSRKQDELNAKETTSDDEDESTPNDFLTSSYWYQCDRKGCHLKPCVERWLEKLKSSHGTEEDQLFRPLLKLIRKMLKPKPRDRVKAGTVSDTIGDLLYQADVNFIRHDHKNFGLDVAMGGDESDNTTCVASDNMPVPRGEIQRSRGNSLELPSFQRSPAGRIPEEEVIQNVGSGFGLSGIESEFDSGADTDIDPAVKEKNKSTSSTANQPAVHIIDPEGRAEPIGHLDVYPAIRKRRQKSLDLTSTSIKIHRGNVSTTRVTRSDLTQEVYELERDIRGTTQENATLQKPSTDGPIRQEVDHKPEHESSQNDQNSRLPGSQNVEDNQHHREHPRDFMRPLSDANGVTKEDCVNDAPRK